jgi:hypothetical protein
MSNHHSREAYISEIACECTGGFAKLKHFLKWKLHSFFSTTDGRGMDGASKIALSFVAAIYLGLILILCAQNAHADEISVWLTTGEWSHHNNGIRTDMHGQNPQPRYRENNTGAGIEIVTSEDTTVKVGYYANSIHKQTVYWGGTYTPLRAGPIKIGIVGAMATGYCDYIPATPIAGLIGSVDNGRVGLNVLWMPTVVIAIQLKARIF